MTSTSQLITGMYYWCKFTWSTSYDVFQYRGDGFFMGIGSDEYISFLEFEDLYIACGMRHDTTLYQKRKCP